MKRSDIFKTILAEAIKCSLNEVETYYQAFIAVRPLPGMDNEISEPEAQQLLSGLRNELPGIRQLLVSTGLQANPGGTQGRA